jgi:hypothetical protein
MVQHIKWLHEMLKELPCLSKEKECKVNVVQGEEGWKTPEDTWMEMGEMEEEVFFMKALQAEELNTDEELEAKIPRTEVAIDDCFQSRAKRIGVAVSEPGDKCMSEKERDLLSEKFGDGIGDQGGWVFATMSKEVGSPSK